MQSWSHANYVAVQRRDIVSIIDLFDHIDICHIHNI